MLLEKLIENDETSKEEGFLVKVGVVVRSIIIIKVKNEAKIDATRSVVGSR